MSVPSNCFSELFLWFWEEGSQAVGVDTEQIGKRVRVYSALVFGVRDSAGSGLQLVPRA